MHIAFLSPHCDPQADLGEPDAGGQCVYEHELAKALAEEGHTVSIFCRNTGRREEITQVNPLYTIYRISCGVEGFIPKERLQFVLPEFVQKILGIVTEGVPDILYGHYWDGGKAGLHMKKFFPTIPLVWTPHSLGVLKRQKFAGKLHEFMYNFIPRLTWENYTLFVSNKIIVSSAKEKNVVSSQYCVEEKKIEIIPPGINVQRLERVSQLQARKKLGLPTRGKIILALGRLTPTKNYEQAIQTLSEIRTTPHKPVYLVIVGGSASNSSEEEAAYKKKLHSYAASLGVEPYVLFHPAVPYDDIRYIYSSADVHLIVSKEEPYGLTVLEAMAAKTPVVAFANGGAAGVITHNVTGSLVDPSYPQRIAGYVHTFLQDREFTASIVNNAYTFVHSKYGWNHQVHKYIQAFEDVREKKERISFDDWVQKNYFLRHNLAV